MGETNIDKAALDQEERQRQAEQTALGRIASPDAEQPKQPPLGRAELSIRPREYVTDVGGLVTGVRRVQWRIARAQLRGKGRERLVRRAAVRAAVMANASGSRARSLMSPVTAADSASTRPADRARQQRPHLRHIARVVEHRQHPWSAPVYRPIEVDGIAPVGLSKAQSLVR